MSKVLVVSDSHGLTKELEILKARHLGEVDAFIHCGDSQLMPDHNSITGYVTVMGNCDYEGFPLETTIEVAGHRLFITHGHTFSVKSSLMTLNYRATEMDADIVCFGHSHVLGAEVISEKLFLNPGSIRLPRERFEKTYMILEFKDETIKLSVFELKGKEMTELSREFVLPIKKK
ncbi:MAG: metallophosphoesterase [Bacillota bacterium]|nr:metallophosphoesterase [Bacillota bacterium]